MIKLDRAKFPADQAAVSELFQEYANSLDFSLDFQNFENELANMEEEYGSPESCLMLAFVDDVPAGCVALRKYGEGVCEMKRLYLRPAYRGMGLGKRLAQAIMDEARHLQYRRMRLDTVPQMIEATALYRALGFREIPAYYPNPVPGTIYFEIDL